MKNFYYNSMDKVYTWAFENIKIASVASGIFALIQLVVVAVIWAMAGLKPALITYGIMSVIGIACWLIQIPYYKKVARDMGV